MSWAPRPARTASRKVALLAMELLREVGELEFDEADKKLAEVGREAVNGLKSSKETIVRQAQAIKRLEAEKTAGVRLKNSPDQQTLERRSWQEMERELMIKKEECSCTALSCGQKILSAECLTAN